VLGVEVDGVDPLPVDDLFGAVASVGDDHDLRHVLSPLSVSVPRMAAKASAEVNQR
jgi:hypothetical protein